MHYSVPHTLSLPPHSLTHTPTVQRTGYACSPVFRFMTASGEWTWVQMEGTYRFDKETREPKHLDIVIKIIRYIHVCVREVEDLPHPFLSSLIFQSHSS